MNDNSTCTTTNYCDDDTNVIGGLDSFYQQNY